MLFIIGALIASVTAVGGAFLWSRLEPAWLRYAMAGAFPLVAALACYWGMVFLASPPDKSEYLRWTWVFVAPWFVVAAPVSIAATYFIARRRNLVGRQ